MSDQHTPGPWRISQNVSRHIIASGGGVVACAELTWDLPASSSVADANARLIAAAPGLLYALKALLSASVGEFNDEHMVVAIDLAHAAIAEATGEQA